MQAPVRVGVARPLVGVVALILLPGLSLGYFGLRGLAEREDSLRTNYTAATVLVRDRLAAELSRLESGLQPPADQAALAVLETDHPWLQRAFILRADGCVMAALVQAGCAAAGSDPLASLPAAAALVADAERHEFARDDLAGGLARYRRALALTPASARAARAFLQTRIGRTLGKLRRFDEAAGPYQAALAVAGQTTDRNGLPYAVIALTQLADGFDALGRVDDRTRIERELAESVIAQPWDLDSGYARYLGRVSTFSSVPAAARDRLRALMEAAAVIDWIRGDAGPRLAGPGPAPGASVQHGLFYRNGQPALLGYQLLPAAGTIQALFGYEVRGDALAGPLLADVLRTVDLGGDLRIALRLPPQDARTSRDPGGAAALAQVPLLPVVPEWRVVLSHRAGRSIAQLVARERWTYGTLIVGMLSVMALGMAFTLRAASRATDLARLQGEFVANVSHELKTPLSLIRMFGETLESGIVSDPSRREEFYGIIRRESERLTHLVNNVLDIGRIDKGSKQYALTPHDLVETVRAALDAYRPLFDRLGFRVETQCPDRPIVVAFDRDAIMQALVNLFQNAIRYSAHDRSVIVGVRAGDDEAYVSVADRGVGVAADQIPRIFDRYYRVPAHASTGAPGSGLGLTLVKHALDAHGGRVEVASTPGRGSVFTLVLPMHGAAAAPAAHPVAGAPSPA